MGLHDETLGHVGLLRWVWWWSLGLISFESLRGADGALVFKCLEAVEAMGSYYLNVSTNLSIPDEYSWMSYIIENSLHGLGDVCLGLALSVALQLNSLWEPSLYHRLAIATTQKKNISKSLPLKKENQYIAMPIKIMTIVTVFVNNFKMSITIAMLLNGVAIDFNFWGKKLAGQWK